MGLAFAAILLARVPGGLGIGGGGGAGAGADGTGSQLAGGSPVPRVTASADAATPAPSEPADVATDAPSRTLVPTENEPSAEPGATPRASTDVKASTYKVKRGDTLSTIADRYDTTWQVLAELNDIKDPGKLRVGQVLDLP
jgi:LysM repeat protein